MKKLIILISILLVCFSSGVFAYDGMCKDFPSGGLMGVAAAGSHTCVLKSDGNVICFGFNSCGEANDYTLSDAVSVAVGVSYSCILKSDNNVECYGCNWYGEAANYTGGDAIGVSAGGVHTCVLKSDGNVDCYGYNSDGQSADYTNGDAIGMSAGKYYTCILKSDGNVDCYGINDYGQSNDYNGGDAIGVSCGGGHTCVLKSDGNVDCYGFNFYGQAANYTGGDAVGVATGEYHTCVLKSDGNVDCYGYNVQGQGVDYIGGDGVAVACGGYHTCVLKSDGNVDCYGLNSEGQANDYFGGDATCPVDIDDDGIADFMDNCPIDNNTGQEDCNTDGTGDACDSINPDATEICDGVDNDCDGTEDNNEAITECDLLDSCTDSGDVYGGGSCNADDYSCVAGSCTASSTSGSDTCGGTADNPSVTYYSCSGGNACVSDVTVQSDSCTDSGGAFGGGDCSASNWDCVAGLLSSSTSSGTDTCGGTETNPTVTYYSCTISSGSSADTCTSALTTQSDSCTDSGGVYGGGDCSADDWTCSSGFLSNSATGGSDTCGGTADNPSVTYYSCSGGNICASAVTAESDSCADSGSEYGGGSCSASNWDCAAGFLSGTSSNGDDSCGGTADNPSVTYYSCSVSDGVAADTCGSAITAESDSCTDTGGSSGGGLCSASNWDCNGGLLSNSATGGSDICSGGDSVDYYSCIISSGSSADTCTSAGSSCNNSLYCDGEEICSSGACQAGTTVDCSGNDISAVGICSYTPDANPFTWDFFAGFTSACIEASDTCSIGTENITSSCDISTCGAECEVNADCSDTNCDVLDGCVINDYYDYDNVSNNCLGDCTCENNTCGTVTIYTSDARCGPKPDLKVKYLLKQGPANPTAGQYVVLAFVMENIGDNTSNDVEWELDWDDSDIMTGTISGLDPNDKSKIIMRRHNYSSSGTYYPTLTVDYPDDEVEYDEGNNERSKRIDVS